MHSSVLEWVGRVVSTYDLDRGRVLEIGSYDVNGSVRQFFPHAEYHGIDVRPGPGVDEVKPANYMVYTPDKPWFDTVISTEVLEHDRWPWTTLCYMGESVRPGGMVVITCRGFGENGAYGWHPEPVDLWRFSVDGMRVLIDYAGLEALEVINDTDPTAPGVFAVARR